MVAALDYMSDGNYEWGELTIPDDVKTFNLVFGVAHSLKVDKWRGPFDNTQDICWHYHGHLNSWKVLTNIILGENNILLVSVRGYADNMRISCHFAKYIHELFIRSIVFFG
ncbi:hypothetical protein GLOIN_2v1834409 [Rhizophagus irregularis DAOM 181602=DAOM 197198]|uniref:Uncharacterized protein n=1 Tax=Rhizophagus irregularis (strain DAOM 181602 / DAOM 197198 / MUCL 43194) TaxID=747089 RepID=A0A2P4QXG5_RHIID|nr:hypothetical protein GLOIN_2v1834409 [Rhizophagus irregularis DAOM 181602=DAOM 197198]POG82317.1 hypothetical protein GLOIN_2v1834409 [Rhizophagus irregularis DAOM 181602=DAOM 197198]|eukprot:XP_025189183.1 hypothetical protein GLOIN_2v1834409 [Rhizophagus irregularis DAOM 181602=DAOM 197198]